MESKQTAVEWLFRQLWEEQKDKMVWYAIMAKAKEMEKEQIVDAFNSGQQIPPFNWAEKYYNESFKK